MITEIQYEIDEYLAEEEAFHEQQLLEQQQEERARWERDIELSCGEPDVGNCDGCGGYSNPVRITSWTAKGFRLRFGDFRANQLLSTPLPSNIICLDGILEDTDHVGLCHECEYDSDNWSDEPNIKTEELKK